MKPLALAAVVLTGLICVSVRADEGAKLFADTCAGCHSIGGGDGAGPDLIRAAKLPVQDLRKAVTRMQDNVGPLKPEQIEELVEFLKKPDAQKQLAALTAPPPVVQLTPEQKAASADVGRKLFFGGQPFANGGAPCFGCHSVAGRGGNLAIDLTAVYARRGEAALVATEEQPAFPLMKAAYAAHAVTPQEAWHLAAFFKQAANTPPALMDRPGVVHGAAAGVAAVVLAGIAVLVRPRRRR